MNKVYIISEIGYDYNDENMFPSECGGSLPKHVYSSREKATKAANDLSIKKYREVDITKYA